MRATPAVLRWLSSRYSDRSPSRTAQPDASQSRGATSTTRTPSCRTRASSIDRVPAVRSARAAAVGPSGMGRPRRLARSTAWATLRATSGTGPNTTTEVPRSSSRDTVRSIAPPRHGAVDRAAHVDGSTVTSRLHVPVRGEVWVAVARALDDEGPPRHEHHPGGPMPGHPCEHVVIVAAAPVGRSEVGPVDAERGRAAVLGHECAVQLVVLGCLCQPGGEHAGVAVAPHQEIGSPRGHCATTEPAHPQLERGQGGAVRGGVCELIEHGAVVHAVGGRDLAGAHHRRCTQCQGPHAGARPQQSAAAGATGAAKRGLHEAHRHLREAERHRHERDGLERCGVPHRHEHPGGQHGPVPQVQRVRAAAEGGQWSPGEQARGRSVGRGGQHEQAAHARQHGGRSGKGNAWVERGDGGPDEREAEQSCDSRDGQGVWGEGQQHAEAQLPGASGEQVERGGGVSLEQPDRSREGGHGQGEGDGEQGTTTGGEGHQQERGDQVELLFDAERPQVEQGAGLRRRGEVVHRAVVVDVGHKEHRCDDALAKLGPGGRSVEPVTDDAAGEQHGEQCRQ